MCFRCTTAPFTVSPGPRGFILLCGLAPGWSTFYGVRIPRLTALPRASFRPALAGRPLPRAGSWRPMRGRWSSYRGLAPHESHAHAGRTRFTGADERPTVVRESPPALAARSSAQALAGPPTIEFAGTIRVCLCESTSQGLL